MKTILAVTAFVFSISSLSLAQGKVEGPCKQIADACTQAGFAKGDWKKGDGLWADCACPAITGVPNPKATKSAPAIDAGLISACTAKKPNICAKYKAKISKK